jgi:hypothetical protein
MENITCGGTRQWDTLKTVKQHKMGKRVRKYSGRELDWLKQSACTNIILRQKSHWTMNRLLNNEGQELKTGHAKGRALTGEGE